MEQFPLPESLSLQGNIAENWRRWKQRFELYMVASGKDSKSDEVKAATFLHLAGPEALEVFNTLSFDSAGDEKKLDKVIEKFEAYCIPRKNVTWERHVFNTRNQRPGETIDQYITDLRNKAKTCEFGTLTESLIKDRLVCGVISDKTRSRLLKQANLTLSGALDTCRADEITAAQMKAMSTQPTTIPESTEDTDIKLLKMRRKKALQPNRQQSQCNYCGGQHHPQQSCPAIGAECRKCSHRNHFARVCRSGNQKIPPRIQELDYESPSEDEMIVATIEGTTRKDWDATIIINSQHVTFKIDTGAQCNVMSSETYNYVSQQPLMKSNAKLVAFGGHRLTSLGRATLMCEHKNKFWPVEFEVLNDVSNVLGLKTSAEMRLVKRIEALTNDTLTKYANTFTGLGCITKVTHHIQLHPNHKPVIYPPRKVPVTIRSKVKDELERMERLEVIERIQEPTDWVNSMVTVIKPNGKLRICIDPRDLNKAIRREYYPMRTIEEISTRMPNAKYFSVLDASSGFWQVKLDHESAKLCTFNTPFGRYMFKRLPFGISSAQDVFQSIMSEMFEDIEGVEVVIDDLLIWGTTEEEHDARLEKVLQRAQQRNLKLNKDKSQIKLKEIKYIGHILSEDGIKPDPKKVTAVTEMKPPTTKEELQRFLGMTTYLSKFISNYSTTSAPLRMLLEKNTEWHWMDQQKKAFQKLKNLITGSPVLKFFDPTKATKISVDASSRGMGAVLLQDQYPIASPFSSVCHNMTMHFTSCSQIILQKSFTVCGRGPCVAMYTPFCL